jgi:hypothetical protein
MVILTTQVLSNADDGTATDDNFGQPCRSIKRVWRAGLVVAYQGASRTERASIPDPPWRARVARMPGLTPPRIGLHRPRRQLR